LWEVVETIVWYDQDRNILIYETQDPRLLQFIPDAVKINGQYIAMPATIPNMAVLRVFKYPVIRPLVDYDFPRQPRAIPKPFDSQVETANFLAVNPRACDLSDMGAGKTMSALWAADAVMRDAKQRGRRLRTVVAAPLSTLQSVWLDAINLHFAGRRKGVLVYGTEAQRVEALDKDADFYVINHDGLKTGVSVIHTHNGRGRRVELKGFAANLAAREDIQIAIVDEVGAFRDNRTIRSRTAQLVLSSREYLWLLTGTPTPNGPLDAYGIGKLLNNCHGESRTAYENRVLIPVMGSRFKKVAKRGAHEMALKLLEPAVRFPVDLSIELSIQNHDVELSSEQKALMVELRRELLLKMEAGEKISAVNEAALRTKLLQICCGAIYDDNHKAHTVDCGPRLAALTDLIKEQEKILVFAPFTSAVNVLNIGLEKFSRAVITGETSFKDRTAIMKAFQNEEHPRVLLANAEPISRGQTLTAACVSVWWGPIDKTETYLQANRRIFRPGQTRNCTVVNLAASRTEREIYRRLRDNESMQGLMLKLVELGL
jgi:SNF2 family DNA or RNA helicase